MTERVESEALGRVLQCFPEWQGKVASLMHSSDSFQELCNDYIECLKVIERLRGDRGTTDPRLEQYCELRVILEQELRCRITHAAKDSS